MPLDADCLSGCGLSDEQALLSELVSERVDGVREDPAHHLDITRFVELSVVPAIGAGLGVWELQGRQSEQVADLGKVGDERLEQADAIDSDLPPEAVDVLVLRELLESA